MFCPLISLWGWNSEFPAMAVQFRLLGVCKRWKWTPAIFLQWCTMRLQTTHLSLARYFFHSSSSSWHCLVVIVSVWRISISVDGEPEAGRKLQPPPGANREACGAVCQLAEDRSADGFPQWVLCSSQTTGTTEAPPLLLGFSLFK